MTADVATALVVAMLAAIWFFPTLGAAPADADGYLQHVSAVAAFDHRPVSDVHRQLARKYGASQPGWFPLGAVPLAIWLADPPIRVAKEAQFALVIVSFATFAIVARHLFQSSGAAVVAAVVAIAAWQLRVPHDPVVGTSFVSPWLAEWVLLGYAAWFGYCTSRNYLWLALCCVTTIVASLTAPLGAAFGTVLAVFALSNRQHRSAGIAVLATAAITIGLALAHGAPHSAWERPAARYASDLAAQLIAPLPTSYRAFGHIPVGHVAGFWHGKAFVDDRFVNIPAFGFFGWCRIAVCTLFAFAALRTVQTRTETRARRPAVQFGVSFWIVPALVLGPLTMWRGGMPLGQSFDVVYCQYFGIAVLATVGILRLHGASVVNALTPTFFALTIFLLCYGNVRADSMTIAQTVRVGFARDVIERAGVAGFFDLLPRGATVAVYPSEPFADGIHSSVADAKYAIYHFSKRRFAIVATNRLDRRRVPDAWILETSRTSLMQVTLAHWAGNDGRTFLTDRAYGFSADANLHRSFDSLGRGVTTSTLQLRDGTAVEVHRTCGPVAVAEVFTAATPRIAWGASFHRSGPFGYATTSEQNVMFMGSRASIVLEPSPCASVPLLFTAIVAGGGAGTLTATYLDRTTHIALSSEPQPLNIHVKKTGRPVKVTFNTDSPASDLDPILYRYQRDRPRDLRVKFAAPVLVEEPPLPIRRSRRAKQR